MTNTKLDKISEKKIKELMNRLDELSLLKHKMSVEEAQEILDDYARVQVFLNESTCYPSPYKPESLLPRKKEKIEIAFAIAMKHADDAERKHILYISYCDLIDRYRLDKEAEELNNKFLTNPELFSAVSRIKKEFSTES